MAYSWTSTFPSAGSLIQSDTYWAELKAVADTITSRHCGSNCTSHCNHNSSVQTSHHGSHSCSSNNGHNSSVQTSHHGSHSCSSNNGNNSSVQTSHHGSHTSSCGNRSNYANYGNCPNNSNNSRVYKSPYSCRSVKCEGAGQFNEQLFWRIQHLT